ncbi:MAG: VOC family protein [Devosiaceae bacterium]
MTPKNALDHVVVGVPDLVSARTRLSALGFQVQDDAHHPFGTGNCNVFFENGTYFEPLAVTDRDAELVAMKGTNPFVKRYHAYRFRHGYGPIMAAFTTDSAQRMKETFEREGISAGDILSFTRKQAMPDGSETTIGVHLAVSASDRAPDITLFCCEHLSRDVLWKPERTEHPNGAKGVTRLIAVETNPSDFQYLFQTVTGDRELRTTSFTMEMDLPNANVNVVTPTAYTAMTGEVLEPRGRGPRIEAVEMLFANLDAMRAHLRQADVAFVDRDDHLVIARDDPFALTVIAREG